MTTARPAHDAVTLPTRLARRPLLILGAGLLAGQVAVASRRQPARAQDQPPATPAAASPVASPSAASLACPADGPCPIGCWVVSDIAAFIESGLMDITGIRNLSYRAAEGTLGLVFRPDGVVRIVADDYRVTVSAEVRFVGDIDTAVAFDGELTGRYALAGEELTIAEVTRKDLVITADTPVGSVGIDNDDFFSGGASRLVCDSATDTLRLYPDPANEAAIVLTRQVGSRFE